jgi:hypothetical protein
MAKLNHLVVTFDVPRARPGDRRYKDVDELLATHGVVSKVFKQVRLILTATDPRPLSRALSRKLGASSTILIVHAAKPYRFVLGNNNKNAPSRPAVTRWMKGAK